MPGFSGRYYYTLDQKGRVIIPAPFREILSSNYTTKLIFTNDAFDRCLNAYPVDEWNILMDKVKGLPQTLDSVRYFMRRVIGSAIECEIDKQGRVLIPSALRSDAGLNNDVVLLGQGDRIVIWDKKELEGVDDPSKIDRKAYMEQLSNLGL
ncbi:MAG: division/cell wall cluster transcriptional repressor MraZ [Thermodesulfovibrionia bacterium]